MSGDHLMVCEYVPFLVPGVGNWDRVLSPRLVRFLVRLLVTLAHVFAFNTAHWELLTLLNIQRDGTCTCSNVCY